MVRSCWCSPRTKEQEHDQKRAGKAPSDSKEKVAQARAGVVADGTKAPRETSQLVISTGDAARKPTLQELSTLYQRGNFDPADPSWRQSKEPKAKTASNSGSRLSFSGLRESLTPKTPNGSSALQPHSSNSRNSNETSTSNYTEDSKSEKATVYSIRSVNSAATSGRPQPVHELQQLLSGPLTPQISAKTEAWSSGSLSNPAKRSDSGGTREATSVESPVANGNSHEGGKRTPKTPKRQKALRRSSFGSPVTRTAPNLDSLDMSSLDGYRDPLQGNDNYEIIGLMQPGQSGSLYVCLDKRKNDHVVVKMLSRGLTNAKAAEREVANLRLCCMHPYIIHFREVFVTDQHLAIAMDFAEGGDLAAYIDKYQSSRHGRGISEERTRNIFQQIVVAIDYCHKMGIANRDIKLENVLLMPGGPELNSIPIVKLSDFGFSKDEYVDSVCKTACGTPECVAPEILSGENYDGKFSDVWSLGVLFFAMLTGTFPFSRPSDAKLDNTLALKKLFSRISKIQYPMPQHISKHAQSLLEHMLKKEPSERITVPGILQHPFFGKSLKNKALTVNESLLAVPDQMLTGFALQTDDEISEILRVASQRSISTLGY